MKPTHIIATALMATLIACSGKQTTAYIDEATKAQAFEATANGEDTTWLRRGIDDAATLWQEEDGTKEEFIAFCHDYYAPTKEAKEALYNRLSLIMEQLNQSADELSNFLQQPTTQTDCGEPTDVDWILAGYDPAAHISDDMFRNKVAFICRLNFPHFTLEEKNAAEWSRLEWAYARMGDLFVSRTPAKVRADITEAYANAELYIADYNIPMHQLLTEDGRRLWPEGTLLLSHWNLRDELKSAYADVPDAHEKQEMIYQLMLSIIRQDIPAELPGKESKLDWCPTTGKCYTEGKEQTVEREADIRYQQVINNLHALLEEDKVRPDAPNYITRHFENELEMPYEEVEALFTTLLSSEEIGKVGQIIRQRLGRELRPYDIWYDGFKSRSAIPENLLTAKTQAQYPDASAFRNDMPRMLMRMGFSKETALFLQSHILVDPARGSGHARPCVGKGEPARLRTRIAKEGMDYKGYNIAVHEFGHNVEEVMSLYRVDHYPLAGIPNDGFTEASAFLFQHRDLQLLGYPKQPMDSAATLDVFWGMYEIMGVSLLDMHMWQWLYKHPEATASQLREAVLEMAADIWNLYYEPILGEHDCPLLAIYSHMIGYPLYLPGYPIGHLVQFQLEEHLATCEDDATFAKEYERIYTQGRLTPSQWMQGAVGAPLSVEPVLRAVSKIIAE